MLHRLYGWYGKRVVLSVATIILVLLSVSIFLIVSRSSNDATNEETTKKTVVTVKRVSDIAQMSSFTTVGTVEAVSEARLQTESGGRVTAVHVEIGDRVVAGQILASLENRSESASLLQAQGAYEAAQATAASSEVSVEAARNFLSSSKVSAINVYQNAFVTVENIVRSNIDDLFTFTGGKAVGFTLNAQGQAPALNAERNSLEEMLVAWSQSKSTASPLSISNLLAESRSDILDVVQLVEKINTFATQQDTSSSYSQADKRELETSLYASRLTLQQTLQAIEGASSAIESAEKSLEQAQIASQGGTVSASSAQVKIALGSLRAAQANYEKTLVRTPISGEVNALYLKEGQYASPSQQAAIVANNNGLEIRTSVNEVDAAMISIGDSVFINNTVLGLVSAIAPAVDPTTGKIALKVSVEGGNSLSNGSTVSLSFDKKTNDVEDTITIPLSALKITSSGPFAFRVQDDSTLIGIPVTIGKITGESVEIIAGLESSTFIVTDARGLKEGELVEVTQ